MGFQLVDHLFELVNLHAVGVNRRAVNVRAVEAEALDGGEKGGRFDDDFVARRDHGFADQVKRLLAARGDDEAVRRNGDALVFHETGETFAQRPPAFGRAVLQHRAGVVREHGVGCDADTFGVEQCGIGEAANEAMMPGLPRSFEQLADGGGFNVFQAVGELQHGRRGCRRWCRSVDA